MPSSHSSCPGVSRASTSFLMTAKKAWMAGSPAMAAVGNSDGASFRRLRRHILHQIDDPKRGADALGGAVLETDLGIDRNVALAAIDRVDDAGVFFVDDAAADFSGAGEFAVVGVEFLVEQQEPGNALRRRQRGVDGFNLLAQQRVHFGPRGEVGVGGER